MANLLTSMEQLIGLLQTAINNANDSQNRVTQLESEVTTLTYTLNQLSDTVTEVVKKQNAELPLGDYLNPIQWTEGMSVTTGLFYYTTDIDMPAEALQTGVPTGWNNEWFDIIA